MFFCPFNGTDSLAYQHNLIKDYSYGSRDVVLTRDDLKRQGCLVNRWIRESCKVYLWETLGRLGQQRTHRIMYLLMLKWFWAF